MILQAQNIADLLSQPSVPADQNYDEVYAQRFLDFRDSDDDGFFDADDNSSLYNSLSYLDTDNDSALSFDELLYAPKSYITTGYERVLNVHYKETDEESLYLDIYLPDTVHEGNAPVVFFSHGGGWLAGDKHGAANYIYRSVFLDLIEEGFCVVAINYRLVNRTGRKTYVEDCVADCQDAMRYIAYNADVLGVDSNRFFTHGGSAGGHLSMMNLLSGSGQFAQDSSLSNVEYHTVAGIDWFGWADFLDDDLFVPIGRNNLNNQGLIIQPEDDTEEKELAAILEMSPSTYVRPEMPELLIQHGDLDFTVSVEHGHLMEDLAAQVGGGVTLMTYPYGNHNWGLADGMTSTVREDLLDAASDFLIARKNTMRIEVDENGSRSFSLQSSDSTSGQYVITSQPSNGALTGILPNLTYTPNAHFFGADTFQYHYVDGGVASDTITVKMVVIEDYKPGLVAHWTMNEGSGLVVGDVSANSYDGSLVGGAWSLGIDGSSSVEFFGDGERIEIPSAAFDTINEEISISLWCFGSGDQPSTDSVFYAETASGNRLLNIHLPWANSIVYWDAGNNTSFDRAQKSVSGAPELFKGQWNHWVFTKNTNTGEMKIYCNGSLWHTSTGKFMTIGDVSSAVIGGMVSKRYYHGVIDDVQLYNIELSDAEVLALYENNSLKLDLPLEAGSGSVAYDVSGNDHDSAITGASWVSDAGGNSLEFSGYLQQGEFVAIPEGAFADIDSEITLSFWVNGTSSVQPRSDTVFCATNSSGHRLLNIHLPWGNSRVYWDAGNVNGAFDRIHKEAISTEYEDSWNHWVFTKNTSSGIMNIYLNGALWHSGTNHTKSMVGITNAALGGKLGSKTYSGMVDDFQLFSRELSASEILQLHNLR